MLGIRWRFVRRCPFHEFVNYLSRDLKVCEPFGGWRMNGGRKNLCGCRFHLIISTFPPESGGQATYMKTNPKKS